MQCEQCGSPNIHRERSGLLDKAVFYLTGRKPYACWECGWRGRRSWKPRQRPDQNGRSGAAAPVPKIKSK